MLSPDSNFFAEEDAAFADVRDRHAKYAETLRTIGGEESEVRIIAYSDRRPRCRRQTFPEGMILIPTRSFCRLAFGPDLILRLASNLRYWKPDVVTAQSPWAEGMLAWLAARLTGARFLAQIHFDILSPHLAREMKFRFWRPWVAKFLLRRADGIRVVAGAVADETAARLNIPRDRFHVAPVPAARLPAPANSPLSDDRGQVVLFVGRFVQSKNLPLWIDVAERVADLFDDVAFHMVGDGPLYGAIAGRIAESRHRDKFKLFGETGGANLASHYQAADIFLLTSDHEGFGRVIVEAGLTGTATVSTACAGPADLIASGETGYLESIGEGEALAQSVLRVLRDPELKNRLGNQAKLRMETDFSEDRLATRIVEQWARLGVRP